MRKIWMFLLAALFATTMAVAQDTDNSAKQDMKDAGHATKEAAKDVAHGTKKVAVDTKNKVHRDDAKSDQAERDRNALPQSDRDTRRDERLENSVHIVNGPDVDAGSRSATIRWQTNKVAATDVWLTGGGIRGHRTAYVPGGSQNHRVSFAGLRRNTTYTYEIRTREGGERKEGSFTTR